VGDSPWGSRELREQWSDRATRMKWRWWWGLAGACPDVGEEERGAVSGAGCSGAEVPFYKGWGGHRAMIMVVIGGETGGGVNGDLSALKL
jgi:hypothetical protein